MWNTVRRGWHREAEDHVSVRVLRENLFDRFGEVVGSGAGGLQLDQQGQHLLAERVLDQRRLVSPLDPEDLADPLSLGFDASLAAGRLSAAWICVRVSRAALVGVGAVLQGFGRT
ncbi:hypothetical protein ACFVYV_47425 [Streptomyces mirabilis]|uniref:hypothetical protein n=1 Tax=Streptomyces mirabilis TaxID=68239 RepID=UPI0036D78002